MGDTETLRSQWSHPEKPGSGRVGKAYDPIVRSIVEASMQDDGETTAITS